MRVTVKYEERSYGNDPPQEAVTVKVNRDIFREGYLEIDVKFDGHAFSRGPTTFGRVLGASIELPESHARSIATAILWHLENRSGPVSLTLRGSRGGA